MLPHYGDIGVVLRVSFKSGGARAQKAHLPQTGELTLHFGDIHSAWLHYWNNINSWDRGKYAVLYTELHSETCSIKSDLPKNHTAVLKRELQLHFIEHPLFVVLRRTATWENWGPIQ